MIRIAQDRAPARLAVPPELQPRFYARLATELVRTRERAGALVEDSGNGCTSIVWVRPAEIADALLVTDVFGPVRRLGPSCPSPRPPPSRPSSSWLLEPVGNPAPAALPEASVDLPTPLALLGPNGAAERQTLWAGGRSDGRLWVARRVRYTALDTTTLASRGSAVARACASDWSRVTGAICSPRALGAKDPGWETGDARSIPARSWAAVPPAFLERSAQPIVAREPRGSPSGHAIVFGSTGAGKTTFLADTAARAVASGGTVVVIDLHGDLSQAIVGRLGPAELGSLVAIDASRRPVVGLSALVGPEPRAAAHLVASLKRLGSDGGELYWGFRLERLFDAFVRLAQETGGSLTDVYALLTQADRREAARLATRQPELARFVDELGPILRRNPEFLWGAAARLAKVVHLPELAELLAPPDGGVPAERLLASGRSLLVRLPISRLGPEAAAFAGSLVLARVYFGVMAAGGRLERPIDVVLDEVQGLSARLVAEMLAEGRKFGFRLTIASQFPDRLAPDLQGSAAGTVDRVLSFRVPRSSTREVAPWLGLASGEADRLLPELPTGVALARGPDGGPPRTVAARWSEPRLPSAWEAAVARTRGDFPPAPSVLPAEEDELAERLLLAVLGAEERGRPLSAESWVVAAISCAGGNLDPALLDDRAGRLEREGWVRRDGAGLRLTPAGERRLGLHAATGATRESAEHRALLLRAFRIFARHGHQLEIVRQGRYDTTLPDARFRQISEAVRSARPSELSVAIGAAEHTWAWRFFGGRDVHVEAEVSGAVRTARIQHGLEKARRAGAHALFLVGSAERSRRARRALAALGADRAEAQVWTLGGDRRLAPPAEGMRAERSARP